MESGGGEKGCVFYWFLPFLTVHRSIRLNDQFCRLLTSSGSYGYAASKSIAGTFRVIGPGRKRGEGIGHGMVFHDDAAG
jgi:hypothetical protein